MSVVWNRESHRKNDRGLRGNYRQVRENVWGSRTRYAKKSRVTWKRSRSPRKWSRSPWEYLKTETIEGSVKIIEGSVKTIDGFVKRSRAPFLIIVKLHQLSPCRGNDGEVRGRKRWRAPWKRLRAQRKRLKFPCCDWPVWVTWRWYCSVVGWCRLKPINIHVTHHVIKNMEKDHRGLRENGLGLYRNYVLTSFNYVLTSFNYVLTSSNYVLTSFNYVLTSFNYVLNWELSLPGKSRETLRSINCRYVFFRFTQCLLLHFNAVLDFLQYSTLRSVLTLVQIFCTTSSIKTLESIFHPNLQYLSIKSLFEPINFETIRIFNKIS